MNRRKRRRLKRCRQRGAHVKPAVNPSTGSTATAQPILARIVRALAGRVQELLLALVYWLFEYLRRLKQRPPEYWFALLTLVIATIGIFGTWYAALHSAPSAARVSFDTGVVEGAGARGVRSFATPKLHEVLRIRLRLTPAHQDLVQVAISIAPPASVRLTNGCFYEVTGMEGRRSCLEPSGAGRVDIENLAAGETLEVTAEAEVVHPIDGQETIAIEMSSADTVDPSRKQIDLYTPKGTRGEEAAKRSFKEELDGPLHWVKSTFQLPDDVFGVLGDEWGFLSPSHLHSLEQIPYGRVVDVHSLASNRLLGAKIVTFKAIVGSVPVRLRSFRGATRHQRIIREVFALGSRVAERSLWCTTARSSAQPRLSPGDPVLVRAALVGWGLARPFGQQVQAAMLICPVVHLIDPHAPLVTVSGSGGTSAPR
jgi:hypothetical protein